MAQVRPVNTMSDRKSHWDRLYATKSPEEVGWYQQEPQLSLQLIQHTGLHKDAGVIDIGGGASVLADRLHDAGFRNIAVLDLSGKAVSRVKRRLADRVRDIEWYEEDVTEFVAPHPFALWHDRAVFHFLTEAADRGKYVETLKRTLVPAGHVIIAAFAIGGPTRCSGLDIVQYDAEKLSAELGEEFRLMEQAVEMHRTPANHEQKFGYFRFRRDPENV